MQGKKLEQDEWFFYGSLEDLVPPDDPLRRLDAILDLAWLRRETRELYSNTGRPSVDPVVIAKLLLIAYLHGISSERELMRQVQVNLSYRSFLHYRLSERLPDHSNLTRSRQRLGEMTIRKVFEHVLSLCLDAGLVGGELQSVDSTFVQANASLSSLQPRLVAAEAERFTQQLFLVNPGEEEAREKDDHEGKPPAASAKTDRLNDRYVSKTDPDSGLYRRKRGKSHLGFLVHFAVDRTKQIITGVLTTGAQEHDAAQLIPLIDQVSAQGIAVQAVAADRGYSTAAVYHELAEREIEAFIPLSRRGPELHSLFGRDQFTYDPIADRYLCPNGAWLSRIKDTSPERRYRARPQDCSLCPLQARCTSGKARTLKFSRHEAALDRARARQETAAAKRAARERRICSERMFAEAKTNHGLRRAQRRGHCNVHVQALLTATVLNLKRYLRAATRAFPAAAAVRDTTLAASFHCPASLLTSSVRPASCP